MAPARTELSLALKANMLSRRCFSISLPLFLIFLTLSQFTEVASRKGHADHPSYRGNCLDLRLVASHTTMPLNVALFIIAATCITILLLFHCLKAIKAASAN